MAILYDIDAEIHGKSAADRFLGDGRIEIDSNAVEPVNAADRLNRKNGPFAGYDLVAENWAVLMSTTPVRRAWR